MEWTEEEDRIIRRSAREGLSTRHCASKLPGRTRNAVIGRAHRLEVAFAPAREAITEGLRIRPVEAHA